MIPAFLERSIEPTKTTPWLRPSPTPNCCSRRTRLAKTFRPLETFTVVALIDFVAIFAVSLWRASSTRLAVSGESTAH